MRKALVGVAAVGAEMMAPFAGREQAVGGA
jgi:hypothetical protein